MQVNGVIKKISDTQNVSEKFSKREFVLTLEPNSQYPQHVQFELTQDKCAILDKYTEGQEVSVDFNLRGREWNGPQGIKYFNTLQAWRLQEVNDPKQTPIKEPAQTESQEQAGAPQINGVDNEDLPF